ncbi:STAS domain-containing protein [Micromonospora sp. L31]|uniref:STAS domain-containing protein n=1 Tax=Micromonospora sp. L31 TaxID=3452213 RepID=UPI003F890CD1
MSTLERPTGPDTEPAVPIMTLSLGVEGPATVIAVCGEVDMSAAHLITELSEDAIDARPARLVLDLAGVTFFSAHGISALLQTQRAAAHAHQLDPARRGPVHHLPAGADRHPDELGRDGCYLDPDQRCGPSDR